MSDSEPEERPSFGAGGFGLGFNQNSVSAEDREEKDEEYPNPAKRMKFTTPQRSEGATSGAGDGKSNSFASRMMAKMGYVKGQGLGADGRGRLAPIETQLRPQGAGLGAVKEKTKQAKAEEQREAAFRGEVVEDSSEEERERQRQRKKDRAKRLPGSGPIAPARSKIKYRTVAEIEKESEGLEVPNVLKSIIDVTGKETQLGTPATLSTLVPSETEASKIARRAQRELEAFADEWAALQDRKKYYDLENSHLVSEIDGHNSDSREMESIIASTQRLKVLAEEEIDGETLENTQDPYGDEARWERVTKQLESMEAECDKTLSKDGLQELAVAAIHPLFRRAMLEWQPLDNPTYLTTYLIRLQHALGLDSEDVDKERLLITTNGDNYSASRPKRKSTTPYETMIYTLWLGVVRTAITNSWDVEDPTPLTTLFTAWRPLLPGFVLSALIDQHLVPRLSRALAEWKPQRSSSSSSSNHRHRHRTHTSPHIWLFPWLPYLPADHLDPAGPHGSLIADSRRKLRSLITSHDLSIGVPSYLLPWEPLLGHSVFSHLLTSHLLPRLAAHLSLHFVVDPSEQDMSVLNEVMAFAVLFSPKAMAELLAKQFFPKFHAILHQWLVAEPNYDEVAAWFAWWKEQIPEDLRDAEALAIEWNRALETINLALELGDRVAEELPPPPDPALEGTALGHRHHHHREQEQSHRQNNGVKSHHANNNNRPAGVRQQQPAAPSVPTAATAGAAPSILEPSFKDVVEQWSEEQGLLLIPLREAHQATGAPLLRLTASAAAKGGVIVRLRGDVLWARDKNNRERWMPMELGEALVKRAEGM